MSGYRINATIIGAEELQRAFQRAPELTRVEMSRAIGRAARQIEGRAKYYAPVDLGGLRASIHTEGPTATGNNIEARVGTDVKYAAYQEFGTGIYGPEKRPITPKTKPFLRFRTKSGQWITTKSVKGSRPQYYFKKARDEGRGLLVSYMHEAMDNIAEGLTR